MIELGLLSLGIFIGYAAFWIRMDKRQDKGDALADLERLRSLSGETP